MDANTEVIAEELEALVAIFSDSDSVNIASQKNIILTLDKKREFSIDFWLPPGYPNEQPPTYRNKRLITRNLECDMHIFD